MYVPIEVIMIMFVVAGVLIIASYSLGVTNGERSVHKYYSKQTPCCFGKFPAFAPNTFAERNCAECTFVKQCSLETERGKV